MAARPDVLIRYGADTSAVDKATAGLKKEFQALGISVRSVLGAASVGTLATQLRETTQWADNLANAADRVGQSVENVQTLRLEAEKFGLTTQATDTALQRFARRLAEAQQGTGVLAAVFKQYNIELKDTQGNFKTTEAVMEEFAGVLQGIADAGELARVSMAAFDTDGVKLGQTIANLGGTISETTARMLELGRVMEEDNVRQAAALETRWTEMTQTMSARMKDLFLTSISGWDQMIQKFMTGFDTVNDGISLSPAISTINGEILELEENIADLVDRVHNPQFGKNNLVPPRFAEEIIELSLAYDKLLRKREALTGQLVSDRAKDKADKEKTDEVKEKGTTEDEKSKAAKKSTETKREQGEKQISDTRAQVRAEGAYWQAEHDLISALQDKNATAVENARDRMKQAVNDLDQAGGSDYRVNYYEERAGVSDSEAVPSVTFQPVVDAAGLAEMPQAIQAALDAANFTVTVQPILADGGTASIERTAAQEGHDES